MTGAGPDPVGARGQSSAGRRQLRMAARRRRRAPRCRPQTVGQLGLHLAAGRAPTGPTARSGSRPLVRHGSGRVVSRFPTGSAGRSLLCSHRRPECPLLPAAGNRPSSGGTNARHLRRLRIRLHVATLADADGHRPGFTVSRHTPQEMDRARHPHELGRSERTYLFIDHAVHGLGSRACGIDVLPQHALWPSPRRFALVFGRPDVQPAS